MAAGEKNTMISLECGAVTIEGTKNLLAHATEYYKNLFGPAPGNLCQIDGDMWPLEEKISSEDNEELTKPFSIAEIKKALFDMKSNRAPGPDNIPAEFYQHCWEVVAPYLFAMFEWFYEGKLDVQSLNYGIIILLPKSNDANRIQQYRPICLLHCPYKLITNVLDNRAAIFADMLISKHQNAFIKNRNIMDGILILHEVLPHTNHKNKWGWS